MPHSNYTRLCPVCKKELSYKSPISYKFAEDNKQKCIKCCDRKNSISTEVLDKILEMNAQGVLNREIGRALGINHKTVSYYLNKLGKKSNFANQPIEMVSDIEARCKKCKKINLLMSFNLDAKGKNMNTNFHIAMNAAGNNLD